MKDEFVMVPRDLLQRAIDQLSVCSGPGPANRAQELRALLAKPAEQHQSEPVALPERRDESTASYTACLQSSSWNACLDEVAKLGPLYTRPARGAPVYQLRNTVVGNVWRDADKEAYESAAKLVEYERRLFYTHADPAEVELLRGCDKAYAEVWEKARGLQGEMDDVISELDGLRAQLTKAHALLRQVIENEEGFTFDHDLLARIKSTLPVSAEPSAPECYESGGMIENIHVTQKSNRLDTTHKTGTIYRSAELAGIVDGVVYPAGLEKAHMQFQEGLISSGTAFKIESHCSLPRKFGRYWPEEVQQQWETRAALERKP